MSGDSVHALCKALVLPTARTIDLDSATAWRDRIIE